MDTLSEYFSTALRFNATAPFVLSRLAAQAMVDTDTPLAGVAPAVQSTATRTALLALMFRT
jgi:hypothetical protein